MAPPLTYLLQREEQQRQDKIEDWERHKKGEPGRCEQASSDPGTEHHANQQEWSKWSKAIQESHREFKFTQRCPKCDAKTFTIAESDYCFKCICKKDQSAKQKILQRSEAKAMKRVDEGCNKTCYSTSWAQHARRVLPKFDMLPRTSRRRTTKMCMVELEGSIALADVSVSVAFFLSKDALWKET